MKNLLRLLMFGFLCGAIWGMLMNERQYLIGHEARMRTLNKELERENRVRTWIENIEENSEGSEG